MWKTINQRSSTTGVYEDNKKNKGIHTPQQAHELQEVQEQEVQPEAQGLSPAILAMNCLNFI